MQRMKFGALDLSVIDPHERDTRYIYDEIYTNEVYHHAAMRMPVHPVIMDVGANIGIYSIWASQRYKPRTIYCYEASPQTFAYLTDNTSRHIDADITQLHAVNRAVARVSGETLQLHQSPLVSGISTLLEANKVDWVQKLSDSGEIVTHNVLTTTVSTEIAAHGMKHVDLLKIDVEGYFMEVLYGIEAADFGKISNIVAEIEYAEELGITLEKVEDFLKAHGYSTECNELTCYGWR